MGWNPFKEIARAVTGIVNTVVNVVTSVVKAVVNVVADVINFVASPFMGLLGGIPDIPSSAAEAQRQDGVLLTKQGGGAQAIPIIYGYRRVGGVITFCETGSTNNKYLWVAYTFCEGAVEGINEIFIDDTQLSVDVVRGLNSGQIVDVPDVKYKGRVKLQWFPGVYFSDPLQSSVGSISILKDAPSWKTSMNYNGLAVLFARYEWLEVTTQEQADANPFGGGIPQIQLSILGKKVASLRAGSDPNARFFSSGIVGFTTNVTRPKSLTDIAKQYSTYFTNLIPAGTPLGSTVTAVLSYIQNLSTTTGVTSVLSYDYFPNGVESNDYGGAGYIERYSTNPAECLLDYLRNPRYGKGLKNDEIDWDSFYVAAQKCNQEISYTSATQGPILTFNAVLDTNQTLFSNVKTILLNMRGYLPYVQGKYKLRIEDAGNPIDIMSGAATISGVFNRDNIIGEVTYTGIERSSKYNQVSVTYVDPDQKFSTQQVVYPETEAERQTYIQLDGGRENKTEVTFSGITNQQIARDMARLIFNKSRFQETCSITVSAEGFNLEVGDNIFINSNILNFGYVPWRVVSLKLNNDYTFALGCVRNPDFIYPYVIPNTPDTVIAPFIPKGATILPPLSGGQSLIGLIPPVTAPLLPPINNVPVVPINTSTNPPTTVTDGANGGGVGGSSGTVNTGGGAPPVTPPVVNILKDTVVVDKVLASRAGQDLANVDITFNQPDNAAYAGVQVYYKFYTITSTVWSEMFISTRPGPGQPITFRLPNLISQSASAYYVRIRVKYTSGEFSSQILPIEVNTTPSTFGVAINPIEYPEEVASGWTLPTTGASARNDYIEFISAVRITSGGAALTPRAISLTVQQNFRDRAPNGDITGLKVYYKSSSATYWDEALLPFSNYIIASKATVTLSGLGVPASPQLYDLILRFAYRDGSESQIQTRYERGVLVQTSETNFAGNPNAADTNNPLVSLPKQEPSSSFAIVTTTMANNTGAIADVRNTRIGVIGFTNGALNTPTTAVVTITPPTDVTALNNWIGVNVYYRKVTAGENPAFTKLSFSGLSRSAIPGARYFSIPWEYDTVYQIVIVPVVLYSGAVVEAAFSLFGQGYIHYSTSRADFPKTPFGEWISNFNFKEFTTSNALSELQTGFAPGNPVVVINSFKLITIANPPKTLIPNYYELTFDVSHIASFNEVYIWRRKIGTPRSGEALYFGIGRWEKITLNTSFTGTGYGYSGGKFTVRLKLPVSFEEFVRIPATVTTATMLTTNSPAPPVKRISPVNRSGTIANCPEQFYIQVRSGGVTSTAALKLTGTFPEPLNPALDIIAKLGPAKEVVFATDVDDSQYIDGWQRRTTEARTATNAPVISAPNILYNGYSSTGEDFITGAV